MTDSNKKTIGVGGKTYDEALASLNDMTAGACPIEKAEYETRLAKAQRLMGEAGLDAVYLNAGTNLLYFTGTQWNPSERMVGALILKEGPPLYIAPAFEESTLQQFMFISGPVHVWEEHESPYVMTTQLLEAHGLSSARIGLDESTSFFIADGLAKACPEVRFESAQSVTAGCLMNLKLLSGKSSQYGPEAHLTIKIEEDKGGKTLLDSNSHGIVE